jgi:phage protein D
MTALLRPAYVLTFRDSAGSTSGKVVRSKTTPGTSTVAHLRVELGMDGAADRLVLDLGQVGTLRPAVGEQVTVELGYTDGQDPQQVTVAAVVDADPDLRAHRVVGLAAEALLRARVDRTFESATAGSIVNELAQAAGVDVATADDGIDFPAYVVDARRSVYHHIGELAAVCGFDRYVDNEGKLVFTLFTGGRTSHVFEHAKHILELHLDRCAAQATQVTVVGESPGAAKGNNSWAWFAQKLDPFAGRAGSGDRTLLMEHGALRTAAATQQAAQAILTDLTRRTATGDVLVTGAPEVRLGDALRLSGVPEPGVDGTYQVRSVVHDIRKDTGFTTRIGFRSIETPGAAS